MRLFLASFRTLDDPDRLARLVGKHKTGLVIANAIDHEPADLRADKVTAEIALLKGWGLRASELDLRGQAPPAVAGALLETGFVWVRGGNTFVLRRAMGACGLDQLLPQLLRRDAFVYAGYSAGGCVMAPDLAPYAGCDDPAEADRLFGAASSTTGLGVVDHTLVPHLGSPDHPEAQALTRVAHALARAGKPLWPLADGEAVVIDGRRVEVPESMAGRLAALAPQP